jgi:hypothetical protein
MVRFIALTPCCEKFVKIGVLIFLAGIVAMLTKVNGFYAIWQ